MPKERITGKNVTHPMIIHKYFLCRTLQNYFWIFLLPKNERLHFQKNFLWYHFWISIISVNSIIWKLIFLVLKDLLSNVSFPFHYIIHNVYLFSLSTEVLKLLIHTSRMKLNGYIRSMNSFWWTYDESEFRNHRR